MFAVLIALEKRMLLLKVWKGVSVFYSFFMIWKASKAWSSIFVANFFGFVLCGKCFKPAEGYMFFRFL